MLALVGVKVALVGLSRRDPFAPVRCATLLFEVACFFLVGKLPVSGRTLVSLRLPTVG